ncbi:acetyl-CoA carboxylase biotin carboxyl carrier protein [Hydrogenimonas thermophila]|uniref:Biotin carboxyl carrier protein of acetyl-CoA carboxylase n=1 Tax=Hydrogenimonas thermophila TaxID=223786 RepID=A0A1I5LL13_9BACT|nr:acetyl-CoA carboxylase biotin carboxyl carrier protein [Hydrogenimonas thermophila]WOE69943.1 acetyl-CoA carboxylase biotin carboxyl carrier protein [Hydrogenimonas thermophila]WOE72460.1 acetyl-CoA carboxylase biotin carboxyl carrier protein [Hydrogenimonas thermophila]SFO97863.1 acetyl-CoA carboxylase biotin carboxyl carrier protein [Hydrogenimonas thermophila]
MNLKEIKELIKVFNSSDLSKLKVENGDFGLTLEKGGVAVATAPVQAAPVQQVQASAPVEAPVAEAEKKVADNADKITSPMVGTFYRAPSPDSPPFVNVGDTVRKGQTLCILEAMKIMNELEAEFDCKILDILVEDGQPVEYDMPLFLVEKV